MKKTLFVLAAFLFSTASFAQSELSGGLEVGLPMGDFGKAQSVGFGATLKYAYNLNETMAITGTSGYMTFGGKTVAGVKFPSMGFIPVKAGLRFAFPGGFYGEPQLGMTFASQNGASSSGFTYAANLGYMMNKIDLGIRYEGVSAKDPAGGSSSLSFIGLRAAYKFMGGTN